MPISVAYRSLLMPDWIVSTAGSGISMCWNQPSSSSRFTRIAAVVLLDLHDDGRVRPSEQLRQHDAGLPVPEIVRLQARQDQVRLLGFDRLRQQTRDCPEVSSVATLSSSMWMARSAPFASASRIV